MTNLEKLKLLGETLYGPRWQKAVARDLGIHSRQVHRWTTGEYSPNEGHIAKLLTIARRRSVEIEYVIARAEAQQ